MPHRRHPAWREKTTTALTSRPDNSKTPARVFSDNVTWFISAVRQLSYQRLTGRIPGGRTFRGRKWLLSQAFFRSPFPVTPVEVEALKTIAVVCAVGVTVSLLLPATRGLDISAGFF
jgi:hypothetical protein